MAGRAASAAAISTNVPSNGRARRMPSQVSIGRQNAFDAFGDVQRRQRRARNVANIAADLQGAGAGLADELRQPARASHLAAIGLAILQYIDAADASARIDRHRIVDVEMLADDMVDDENSAAAGLPDALGLHPRKPRRRKSPPLPS